ncbi:dethiobiotin synthase [bacterium]|nr:dethiobiotin synthase [bacterium]
MLSVYVAGLKKGTGKTLICSGLAGTMQSLNYAVSYYKPIQTGYNMLNSDTEIISKIDKHIKVSSTYKLQSPSGPLFGAYNEGIKNIDTMTIMHDYKTNIMMTECHIVEGCNGISSPIDEKKTEIDLIKQFGLPVILVINPNITKTDEAISGINYIYSKHVNLSGVIVNDYNMDSNDIEIKYFPHLIKEYTGAKVLGTLPHYDNFENLPADILISDILNKLNIEDIFSLKIAKLT